MDELQEQIEKLQAEIEIKDEKIEELIGVLEDISYQAKHAAK